MLLRQSDVLGIALNVGNLPADFVRMIEKAFPAPEGPHWMVGGAEPEG